MKFWQIVSSFEPEIVKSVLKKPEWAKFKNYYDNHNQLVIQKNRKILDEIMPIKLTKEICSKSNLKFYLYGNENKLNLRINKLDKNEKYQQLNSLEVFKRFGGEFIEESIEKGSSIVIQMLNRATAKANIQQFNGLGWLTLVDIIYDNCPEGIVITEVFQKWGGLEVRHNGRHNEFEYLKDNVNYLSKKICEICGDSGGSSILDGWEKTLCEVHYTQSNATKKYRNWTTKKSE